jgi:hypothetical protein
MGLDTLIRSGAKNIKPIFDTMVTKLSETWKTKSCLVGVKGKERGGTKIKVRYGGNAAHLSDVVRATLEFSTSLDAIDFMYSCIEDIVASDEFRCKRIYLTHFDDRFQNPRGGYMDFLLLFKVHGFVCELQLNTSEVLKVKNSNVGHSLYEETRMANDNLIFAAMTGSAHELHRALEAGANPDASKDMYELTSLHYAAQHGSVEMVQGLLDHGANVFAQDVDGHFAIYRAVLLCHVEVVELLLNKMSAQSSKREFGEADVPALAELAAAVLEEPLGELAMSTEVCLSVARWALNALQGKKNWYITLALLGHNGLWKGFPSRSQ